MVTIGVALLGTTTLSFALGFSALGSWILGVYLKLGFLGVFLAQALDEAIRAVFMLIRWSNNKWMNKSIVKR